MIVDEHPEWPGVRPREDLQYIGYWCARGLPDYPDPQDFVDHDWAPLERSVVLAHLRRGFPILYRWHGSSTCRICGERPAGGVPKELWGTNFNSCCTTDGVYAWPSGFEHYIEEHGVRPPQVFIDHCKVWAGT